MLLVATPTADEGLRCRLSSRRAKQPERHGSSPSRRIQPMNEPLPPSIQKILAETDPLRLVIRAQAEFEQYLTMAIRARFLNQAWPKELKGVGFRQRVGLAVALGLINPS